MAVKTIKQRIFEIQESIDYHRSKGTFDPYKFLAIIEGHLQGAARDAKGTAIQEFMEDQRRNKQNMLVKNKVKKLRIRNGF